jgi:uncharacterized protein YheU (UPF0270 family)
MTVRLNATGRSSLAVECFEMNYELDDERPAPVDIPHTELTADALRGVIEAFVLREGTEYGSRDFSLDEKVAQVMRQLEKREARIVFDPGTETVDIVVTS